MIRRRRTVGRYAVVWLVMTGLAVVSGCAGPESVDDEAGAEAGERAQPEADEQGGEGPGEGSLAESAEAAARRLEEAMSRTPTEPAQGQGQRVQWQQTWPREEQGQGEGAAPESEADAEPEGAEAEAPEADEPVTEGDARRAEAEPEPEPASPEELLGSLLEHVRGANEPAMRRALTAATLHAAVGESTLDPALTQSLGHSERRTVERYQRMVLGTLEQVATRGARLNRSALFERIDTLFEHEPLEIRELVLCREVSGYGIYEPFDRHIFLAGEPQRLIVYVELDHFHAEPTGDDQYEVKLQQQIVLYNEADGLAVWRHDPVHITDVSRNRRRDFFVVQLVTLPARLNVGNYRLKVRVTDEHGGSIDETTTRIQLVADENLLAGDTE